MNPARTFRSLFALLVLLLALAVAVPGAASATPPGIPSEATARAELAALTVRADGSSSGYSRDLFPHWNTVSGACNTRVSRMIATGRYPTLARVIQDARHPDPEATFDSGLDSVLDGIARSSRR